jgi:hypothetical protein
MKIRSSFVSNSSSSSFTILKYDLSSLQLEFIRNHTKSAEMFFIDDCLDCPWTIEETDYTVRGHTSMDNFNMQTFLERIGVKDNHVKWGYYGG